MRILYGICGEGMGHATRAHVTINHLASRGHDVLCIASGQALRVLTLAPDRLLPIIGLGIQCANGALDLRDTLEANARRIPSMMIENAIAWSKAEVFAPDVVITDVEPFAVLFANAHGLPLVSIDNAQILPRCDHAAGVFARHEDGIGLLAALTKASALGAQHYIVTTFFYPPVKPELRTSTTLVPPILREEVLAAARAKPPQTADVLVYKTGSLDDASFLAPLAAVAEQRFIVYGLKERAAVPPNVSPRAYDSKGFLSDLASSRAVVGNGGMSLIGEALALGKPIYAVPVRGQFEQVMNACYLQRLGYGVTSEALDPPLLRQFLRYAPLHEAAIQRVPQHDENQRLYATLNALFPRS